MRAWIIINMVDQDYDRKLDEGHRPSFLHGSRELAEAEALRLAKAIPEGDFWIFEAVASAVPTRTDPSVFLIAARSKT